MTLTLHLAPGTISMCVHAALEETGLPYELAWVDFKTSAQRQAPYLAVNPKGRVPSLVVDGTVLTEAPALMDWIAAATGHLMPDDPLTAARVRETMCYLSSTAHVAHAHKFRAQRWADDPAAQAAMAAKVAKNMTECAYYLEQRLTGNWVVDDFSAADLYLWNVTRWMPGDGVEMADVPKLAAHHDRVAARPAVARVIELHTGG
ncbi:glutathione S-transferase [Jannaschia faecimaris]|uniref:Glutathione S-transferase n=1 Tax=Jannaschia faecimaris TaxID=1244108 RepID=A0A1H3RPV9_9RHOB|nr:glutathione S-transferase family protein [Jannaschia faecimaris]SDZ27736.1 glutathione S-transferase [Jannaschia faecimaris]